jgi:hypothetical protein
MSRTRPPSLDESFAELNGGSDRAAIIVGGALLEYALELAIESRLREPQNTDEKDKIFGDKGIFSTFSEKIIGAYFLKIIGPMVKKDLDVIRKIRNDAAHHPTHISFCKGLSIHDNCKNLKMYHETGFDGVDSEDMKEKFLTLVKWFAMNLLLRANDGNAEIAEATADLAPSLDR